MLEARPAEPLFTFLISPRASSLDFGSTYMSSDEDKIKGTHFPLPARRSQDEVEMRHHPINKPRPRGLRITGNQHGHPLDNLITPAF